MLYKILIKVGLRHEQQLLRVLSKIEFGVAIFCRKLAQDAIASNYPNLAKLLLEHSLEEKTHGKMLASLADGRDRPVLSGTGTFLSIIRGNQETCKSRAFPISNPLILVWDSAKVRGEKVSGTFENFDGLSKRYLSLRIFFKNHHAFSYSWGDRLCFMQVLEAETCRFYEALSNSDCGASLKAIARKIACDETGHKNYLSNLAYCFPDADIKKWESRLFWAKLGLIFDLVWILAIAYCRMSGSRFLKEDSPR